MQIRYWTDAEGKRLQRNAVCPDHGWRMIDWREAVEIARTLPGWVVVKIHEIDYHALLGDGWKEFAFEPTAAQRERCRLNHQGRELEDIGSKEGLRWEEIVAILTVQPWRRLIPMRAFTTARDWPLSVPR